MTYGLLARSFMWHAIACANPGFKPQATAVYVWLSTLASGRFSDNGLVLRPGKTRRVSFVPFGELEISLLKTSLRVEHLQQHLAYA